MIARILIQRDCSTGRFHPAFYNYRPLPGPFSPAKPLRFKSGGHHTNGFVSIEDAQTNARELAAELTEKGLVIEGDGPYEVRDLPECGADVLIVGALA